MPASWELGGVLALGFALFNQMLFAAMDLRALALEEIALAGRFAAVSVLAGVVVLAAHGFLLWVARPKSWTDAVALVVSMGVGIGVGFLADGWLGEGIVIGLFFFNMLIGLWLARGLRFGRSSKKAQNG